MHIKILPKKKYKSVMNEQIDIDIDIDIYRYIDIDIDVDWNIFENVCLILYFIITYM